MLVLGIDPGSLFTGFGVIETSESGEALRDCGVIRLPSDDSHPLRLKKLYASLVEIVELHLPDVCAVEMPVYGDNAQSMLKLGRAQSAAMLAALNHEIPVSEYTPKEIKKAVTGNGNATKQQVDYMVRSILSIPRDRELKHDTTDALAVCLCHAQRNTLTRKKTYTDWSSFVRSNPERAK